MYLLQAETSFLASTPNRVKHHCTPSYTPLPSNSVYDPLPQINTLKFSQINLIYPGNITEDTSLKMGNILSCTHVDLDSTVTPATVPPPSLSSKTRKFKCTDKTMLKPIAVAHHYHERLLCSVEREGIIATRFSGILNPLGLDNSIDWTLEMSDPFIILHTQLCTMGLQPEVAVERFPQSPMGYRMVALTAAEGTDWITPFFQNPTNLQTLGEVCDFSIQNNGQMLVIQPKHLCTTPDGSMISLDTQYGSLLMRAKDCNWDTSHAIPCASS